MKRANPRIDPRFRLLAPLVRLAFSRRVRAAAANARRLVRRLLRASTKAARQPSHLMRVLRRLRVREQARHQDKTGTDHP